tara:strand:- start:134 stop:346 length:213 start_codon:yes stop_codon:yes gene_type:complete
MDNHQKLWTAIRILKSNVECTVNGDVFTEDDFKNNILWKTGVDKDISISSINCPHSEITWTKVKAEMDKL